MITIEQQPYDFTPLRQRLIVNATSDNTGNSGFQYKVEVEVNSVNVYTGYHPPNPVNALIFDIRPVIEEFIYLTSAPTLADGLSTHSIYGSTNIFGVETTGSQPVKVTITEAWTVAGVLTDDPDLDGPEDFTLPCVWPASYQYEDGYRPNPSVRFAIDSTTSRACTDRDWNTHRWKFAESFGFPVDNTHVFIPVFESDYGVITAPIDQGTNLTGNALDRVRITILKADGTTATTTRNVTPNWSADIAHFAVYPANINDSGIGALATIKPSANPGWVALSILFENSTGTDESQTYVLYNAELYGQHDCRYDRVRIGWSNSAGGWDYFNFIKKSEQSVQVERRRWNAIAGNYAAAGAVTDFATPNYQRGLSETKPKVQRFLDITSDWISEGEFALLKWLVVSTNVHWLQDDGSVIPVVVENNDFVSRVATGGKVYNQTMRLRLAHDLNV